MRTVHTPHRLGRAQEICNFSSEVLNLPQRQLKARAGGMQGRCDPAIRSRHPTVLFALCKFGAPTPLPTRCDLILFRVPNL
jgi:hypothetical protein